MAIADFSGVLDQEIERQLLELAKMSSDSPEFAKAEEALSKLYGERVKHYIADLNDDNERTKQGDEKDANDRKLKIEEDKVKLEQDRLEFDKSKQNDDNESAKRKLKIEEDRIALEKDQLALEREKTELESNRLAHEKLSGWLKFGSDIGCAVIHAVVEAAGIVLPLWFYHEWMQQGLEFEKEGCFTSSTFKGLIAKLKPTKK